MKYAKIIRILGMAVILSLLMMALPLAPVLAANDITLSPTEGKIGDTINISGSNFLYGSQERQARIIVSSQQATINKNIGTDVTVYRVMTYAQIQLADEPFPGTFSASFQIPDTITDHTTSTTVPVTSGTYYVYISITTLAGESPVIVSVASFTVIGGEISINPSEGPVDTFVEITGTSFATNQAITVTFGGNSAPIEDGSTQTDSNGSFSSFIIVPETTAGAKIIAVTVGASTVEANFTVKPDIIITPQSGEAGTEVTISGTGFARRPKEAYIYFNSQRLDVVAPMDTRGSFATSFFVPEGLAAGVYSIEAEDDDQNLATASFTLNVAPAPEPPPEPTPAPTPTPPLSTSSLSINQSGNFIGSLIGIGGAGFKPNATVTVKYDDQEVATATADNLGVFVVTFEAPPSKGGAHTITASDGTNSAETTFTVESVPPDVPPPLLPEMGVKVKSPVTFDWESVTDDSHPVTYTLQIADDEDFDEDSIVLEITEIEESEYILSTAEELELAAQERAYYWRVRAVDGASNASEWTGAGEFFVAPPFSIPNWALYTFLGIGAVLIFGIGYWLGRRTAFYY